MQTKWAGTLVATFFVALFSVGITQAATITPGNHPEPNEENLLLNSGLSGLTVLGTTNQSGAIFQVSGNETLTEPSSGQARVEAVDGSFTFLSIVSTAGTTFHDIILNPGLAGTGQMSGSLVFTLFMEGGASVVSGPFTIAQGGNFFTIVAGPGEAFIGLSLSETGANQLHDVSQIRISGVCIGGGPDCEPPRVAEPAMLSLLGSAMVGLVAFTSRRRNRR
jgi:hypothetical protein